MIKHPETVPTFRALADATRQRLLQLLGRHELNVHELVTVLGQPQSTVSRHLKVLRDAGLVSDRRDGTTVYYRIASPNGADGADAIVRQTLEWIAEQPLAAETARGLTRVLSQRTAESREFFEELGNRWDSLRVRWFGEQFHLESLVALLPADWTVADVGAGTGFLIPLLASHFKRVIAVDHADAMLAVARDRVNRAALSNAELRSGSLEALPIADADCDLVIAMLVLHHVASPATAVREMARVLRPGGRLLIVEQVAHEHEAFAAEMGDRWWGFEPGQVERWVREAGVNDVRLRPLVTAAAGDAGAADAPKLFVVTGQTGDR